MPNYAIIENGVVVNIIVANSFYTPPAGQLAIQSDTAQIGWVYENNEFIAPNDVPPSKSVLMSYASDKQAALAAASITVNIAAAGQPALNVVAAYNAELQEDVRLAQVNPNQMFTWLDTSGSSAKLTAAQVLALYAGVGAYRQATLSVLADVNNAINEGKITEYAQIDNPTLVGLEVWPVN